MEGLEKPVAGAEIDGYRLVRPIGQGGFGTVWLCWSEASQSYHALKWVSGDAQGLNLELHALRKFREISQKLRSPNLIAIEHINRLAEGLIYTLPLADGIKGNDPSADSWRPMTLAAWIEEKRDGWFSASEIRGIIVPIIHATASLNDEGLVHRDIKPANILFLGGVPCLADMGLLANDSASLSQRGTPGFLPPSWYLESSGQPDMWGLATTLYTLLTGNNPDKMGRPKFLWPPNGKDSLSLSEQKEWQRLHAVIYRATHERASERFRDFQTFAAAVEGTNGPTLQRKSRSLLLGVAGLILAAVLAWGFLARDRTPRSPTPTDTDASLTFKTPEPANKSEQGMSAARQQLFDNEATAITRKLESYKSTSAGDLQLFREKAAAILEKMRTYKPDAVRRPDLALSLPANSGESKTTDASTTEKVRDEATLLEIRDALRSLATKLPEKTLKEEMDGANRLYQSLVDAAYAKTTTADEKFYFNDSVRPRLDGEFERIFDLRPGMKPVDGTILNLTFALASPKWSGGNKEVVAEIRSAINQISERLNR